MSGKERMTRRQQSRMAQNNRRKIQRRMARIISEVKGSKVSWKEAISEFEKGSYGDSGLQSLYKTYQSQIVSSGKIEAGKSAYSQNVESVSRAIKSFTEIRFGNESNSYRRNEMFQRDVAQSTRKEGLSTLSGELTHGFYAATQYMWEKASSPSERNAMIMREFGLNDFQQIYNLVTKDELKKEDFGFNDEELFQQWFSEIKERVDLDTLRDIMKEELGDYMKAHDSVGNTNGAEFNAKDKWNEKYEKIKVQIQNIRKRTATRLRSRY